LKTAISYQLSAVSQKRGVIMQDFRNLKVWHKAHALTIAVYHTTAAFPGEERFGLTLQLRRTGMAIPTNVADGCGRTNDIEFAKALSSAMGEASRLEYQLLLAHDLGFLPTNEHSRLAADVIEVKKMLAGLLHNLHG
jgi:four helix bundle protein